MTDTTTQTGQMSGQLAGTVLFYGKPEPLSVENHGALGVEPTQRPFDFVAKSHIVPLTVTEFAPAALTYPVIFVGEQRQPVAVMGLRPDQNLFVADGLFKAEAYIPAYVRRYPFVFANDEAQQRLILCIDRDAPFVKEGGVQPLFENGQPSAFTQQAMDFCNSFEQERLRTESFVNLLKEHDLFETRTATFTPRDATGQPAGEAQKIAEYFAVSEDKMRALPAEKLAELRDNGALGQIYAHLTSLLGWDRLVALTFAQAAAEPAAANA
ncbi:MAG TPA: SapC family protein [Brevundimonas sp.]|jgi:hypothetical protein|uniref:SapC family protein n=1 Tax=Brevundimonas sp. TaxID=1871086 RepID=UPI002DE79383|nr:SapC family protein [Brevundimonas sp.]